MRFALLLVALFPVPSLAQAIGAPVVQRVEVYREGAACLAQVTYAIPPTDSQLADLARSASVIVELSSCTRLNVLGAMASVPGTRGGRVSVVVQGAHVFRAGQGQCDVAVQAAVTPTNAEAAAALGTALATVRQGNLNCSSLTTVLIGAQTVARKNWPSSVALPFAMKPPQ